MIEQMVGRTRWRKFAAILVPATALVGAMVVGMGNGAIASSFAVSGQQFQISASEMQLDGFAQYGGIVAEANKTLHPVATAAVKKATIKNLCQSVVTQLPFATVTLQIRAGGKEPVTAENMFVDMTQLEG
ncbi:MAG: cholesterol esterase, partial [Longispora sp.]|nr:cholesterol esterase [Longispora sp. (in: high G+C Gram-positive bacteria)]